MKQRCFSLYPARDASGNFVTHFKPLSQAQKKAIETQNEIVHQRLAQIRRGVASCKGAFANAK
jgi:hypothetical protein